MAILSFVLGVTWLGTLSQGTGAKIVDFLDAPHGAYSIDHAYGQATLSRKGPRRVFFPDEVLWCLGATAKKDGKSGITHIAPSKAELSGSIRQQRSDAKLAIESELRGRETIDVWEKRFVGECDRIVALLISGTPEQRRSLERAFLARVQLPVEELLSTLPMDDLVATCLEEGTPRVYGPSKLFGTALPDKTTELVARIFRAYGMGSRTIRDDVALAEEELGNQRAQAILSNIAAWAGRANRDLSDESLDVVLTLRCVTDQMDVGVKVFSSLGAFVARGSTSIPVYQTFDPVESEEPVEPDWATTVPFAPAMNQTFEYAKGAAKNPPLPARDVLIGELLSIIMKFFRAESCLAYLPADIEFSWIDHGSTSLDARSWVRALRGTPAGIDVKMVGSTLLVRPNQLGRQILKEVSAETCSRLFEMFSKGSYRDLPNMAELNRATNHNLARSRLFGSLAEAGWKNQKSEGSLSDVDVMLAGLLQGALSESSTVLEEHDAIRFAVSSIVIPESGSWSLNDETELWAGNGRTSITDTDVEPYVADSTRSPFDFYRYPLSFLDGKSDDFGLGRRMSVVIERSRLISFAGRAGSVSFGIIMSRKAVSSGSTVGELRRGAGIGGFKNSQPVFRQILR